MVVHVPAAAALAPGDLLRKGEQSARGTYLRSHDSLGWNAAEEWRREELDELPRHMGINVLTRQPFKYGSKLLLTYGYKRARQRAERNDLTHVLSWRASRGSLFGKLGWTFDDADGKRATRPPEASRPHDVLHFHELYTSLSVGNGALKLLVATGPEELLASVDAAT